MNLSCELLKRAATNLIHLVHKQLHRTGLLGADNNAVQNTTAIQNDCHQLESGDNGYKQRLFTSTEWRIITYNNRIAQVYIRRCRTIQNIIGLTSLTSISFSFFVIFFGFPLPWLFFSNSTIQYYLHHSHSLKLTLLSNATNCLFIVNSVHCIRFECGINFVKS